MPKVVLVATVTYSPVMITGSDVFAPGCCEFPTVTELVTVPQGSLAPSFPAVGRAASIATCVESHGVTAAAPQSILLFASAESWFTKV